MQKSKRPSMISVARLASIIRPRMRLHTAHPPRVTLSGGGLHLVACRTRTLKLSGYLTLASWHPPWLPLPSQQSHARTLGWLAQVSLPCTSSLVLSDPPSPMHPHSLVVYLHLALPNSPPVCAHVLLCRAGLAWLCCLGSVCCPCSMAVLC